MAQHRLVDDELLCDVVDRGGAAVCLDGQPAGAIASLSGWACTASPPPTRGCSSSRLTIVHAERAGRGARTRPRVHRAACARAGRLRPERADQARLAGPVRPGHRLRRRRRRGALADRDLGGAAHPHAGGALSALRRAAWSWPRSAADWAGCGPSAGRRFRAVTAGEVELVSLWVHLDTATGRPTPLTERGARGVGRVDRGSKGDRPLRHSTPAGDRRAASPGGFAPPSATWPVTSTTPPTCSRSRRSCSPAATVIIDSIDVEIEYRSPAQPGDKLVLRDGARRWIVSPDGEVHASLMVVNSSQSLVNQLSHRRSERCEPS